MLHVHSILLYDKTVVTHVLLQHTSTTLIRSTVYVTGDGERQRCRTTEEIRLYRAHYYYYIILSNVSRKLFWFDAIYNIIL